MEEVIGTIEGRRKGIKTIFKILSNVLSATEQA
ncbi:hypothetical protein HDF22_005981 [Mucilaginibacter lappiensis]|uniref:Uncharacterized protein n=1 Tax=Mucilaginibacter lappiensis TaxID=354630 RepID=A0A841JLJ6_9SPHI|nr:hypothetical protein [Mucilaginibacter lappiensis]